MGFKNYHFYGLKYKDWGFGFGPFFVCF